MTTITLPQDLEERLDEAARRRGTTLELLAVDTLRQVFPSTSEERPSAEASTLFDFLSDYIGAIDGPSLALSEDCGDHFARGLEEKKTQGRL